MVIDLYVSGYFINMQKKKIILINRIKSKLFVSIRHTMFIIKKCADLLCGNCAAYNEICYRFTGL